MSLEPKLTPRNPDGVLRVIIPGRISTPMQDPDSIAASQEDNETWLRREYTGPVEVLNVGEQASGWLVDRASMDLARTLIERKEIDLVLMGEIRELFRNPRLQWAFVQDCIDNDTRMISRWDTVDTAREEWEIAMHLAVTRTGMTVPEAKRRVKRKATYTFGRGGMVLKVKFGYRKLTKEEAQSGQFGPVGLRIAKLAEHTPVILEMKRRVLAGHSDILVGKWLVQQGILTGPYVTSKKWAGALVRDLLTDSILSGRRKFRKVISRMCYGTGKHKAEVNPTPLEADACPELAHLSTEEHDELLRHYEARRKANQEPQKAGARSPLRNASRNSVWPGQGVRCSACGSLYYLCGKVMKCKNALPDSRDTCWNHVLVNVEAVRGQVLPLLWATIVQDPMAERVIRQIAWDHYQQSRKGSSVRLAGVQAEISQCEKRIANCLKLLDNDSDLKCVGMELAKTEKRLEVLKAEEREIAGQDRGTGVYSTAEALDLPVILAEMVRVSREFGILMRKLIVDARVVPVQALDSAQAHPRLVFTISFRQFAKGTEPVYEAQHSLDVFESPVQIKHLKVIQEARQKHPTMSLKSLAAELTEFGIGYMTVKRAIDYARLMECAGLTEPYRVLTEPPEKGSRWHRQKPKVEGDPDDRDSVRKVS